MKIEMVFLRSKVARRIFFFFFLSALLPVISLAILSHGQMLHLLIEQQQQQLRESNKEYGLALLDRLVLLEEQLAWIQTHQSANTGVLSTIGRPRGFEHIRGVSDASIANEDPESRFLADFLNGHADHLATGKAALSTRMRPNGTAIIELVRPRDPQHPRRDILIARIDPRYLFGAPQALDQRSQLCVIDPDSQPLFCSDPKHPPTAEQLASISHPAAEQHAVEQGSETLMSHWLLFLKPDYDIGGWTIFSARPKDEVLLPIKQFGFIFALMIPLTLAIVALLSVHQIRKNLVPLERLMDGVKRISNKNFHDPVEVDSGDEFEALADSLNRMAVTIDRQINTLSTMADIDRLILSTLKIEDIVHIVLARMREVVPHDQIAMILIDTGATEHRIYVADAHMRDGFALDSVQLSDECQRRLQTQNYRLLSIHDDLPEHLLPLRQRGSSRFLIIPVVIKEEVSAIISLGYLDTAGPAPHEIQLACDFANRVAVALSNASWEEQLYYMAHYDVMTGLPNRLLLRDRLQQALARSEREHAFVALLFIDLDRFKTVNDSLGHLAGDMLLREVGARFAHLVRAEDTISRIGGDEFVLLIQQTATPKEALSIISSTASKILQQLTQPFSINDRELFTSASIGIACYPTDGETATELLKNADTAMYHAKANGKNNYQFYSKILNAEAIERLEMENGLRRALERNEFELHYQPKVDVATGRVRSAEALLRWNHPQRGRVSPAEFIPLCEELGLIIPIGEWIIRTVALQLLAWNDKGFSDLRIAINLSPLQFRQAELVHRVGTILDEVGMDSSQLEFEVTESAAMENIEQTILVLTTFSAMGIHLSIDDFGTGYSSLNYLKRFPVDALKIDQSFIRNLGSDTKDTAIVTSIITLAHSLGFSVIAEGVETQKHLDFLTEKGCDVIQGYFYSPPIPVDAFTRLLERGPTPFAT